MQKLGRLQSGFERRNGDRRAPGAGEVLSTHKTFGRDERGVFRELERRHELRRDADVRRGIAAVE